eukprot:m.952034 g.952034  ORF g.952034 m.952034 type:complete len:777 (-) comp23867_c0_seq41:2494-4824(-)
MLKKMNLLSLNRVVLLTSCLLAACRAAFEPMAELPPLLVSENGSPVTTESEWTARREELKQLLQEHILGALPPVSTFPKLISAEISNVTNETTGLIGCYVAIKYNANGTSVSLPVELAWSVERASRQSSGLPMMFTQWNHRAWGLLGAQRGYMMVLYPAADARDVSGLFRAAYPQATFKKILARAFVASRVLDFLLQNDAVAATTGSSVSVASSIHVDIPRVDATRACITGHSRNGKQSLVTAAFDERFTAVVGSSPGTPVSAPIRFSSPDFNGETVQSVSPERDWWLQSVRSYWGKEDAIPADGHMIVALIAPRHVMIANAYSDSEGDISFADEKNVMAVAHVYQDIFHQNKGLHIKHRPGRHHGFVDVHSYVDWFDYAGGISGATDIFPAISDIRYLHAFNWTEWRTQTQPDPIPPSPTTSLRERVLWLLGADGISAGSTNTLAFSSGYCESSAVGGPWDYKAGLMMHDSFGSCGSKCPHADMRRVPFSFGSYITANLFVPTTLPKSTELPVVIFVHGFSYQLGYSGIYELYHSEDLGGLIPALVGQGVAVLAWDMTGMGARQDEGAPNFYRRLPSSSRLGVMIGEIDAALDMIHCAGSNSASLPECNDGIVTRAYPADLPALNASSVHLLGYSMGAIVSLHAAALLPRVGGVAAFGGWSPMRGRVPGLDGNRLLFETHALVPRLGFFAGNESRVPYDYDELIAAIAPRPVLLYAPQQDRFAAADAVRAAATSAEKAWVAHGAAHAFQFVAPDKPSDFKTDEIHQAVAWLRSVA